MVTNPESPAAEKPVKSVTRTRHDSPEAVRERQVTFRRRVLKAIWQPVGIKGCGGPGSCTWANGEPCQCKPGASVCMCARRAFQALQREGEAIFGAVIGGALAGLLVRCAEALQRGDKEALSIQAKVVATLLEDQRKREGLALQRERLALEAAQKPLPYEAWLATMKESTSPEKSQKTPRICQPQGGQNEADSP